MENIRKLLLLLVFFSIGMGVISAQVELKAIDSERLERIPPPYIKNAKLKVLVDKGFGKAGLEIVRVGFRENPYREGKELYVKFYARKEKGADMDIGVALKDENGKVYWQSAYKGVRQPLARRLFWIRFKFEEDLLENSELTVWAKKDIVEKPFEMWEWTDEPEIKWLEAVKKNDTEVETVLENSVEEKDTVVYDFRKVTQKPQFPGGEMAVKKYVYGHISYPEAAAESGIQGLVMLQMIVQANGKVGEVKIIREIGGGCGEEAARVVRNMPDWSPGLMDGKPVPVKYVIPVSFRLAN